MPWRTWLGTTARRARRLSRISHEGSSMNAHRLAVVLASAVLVLVSGCGDSVPVVVTFRQSLVGVGIVAQFHNQTNSQLTIHVVIENKEKDLRTEGAINIPPNDTVEIGWLEGWMFKPGEIITISHPNYKRQRLVVP